MDGDLHEIVVQQGRAGRAGIPEGAGAADRVSPGAAGNLLFVHADRKGREILLGLDTAVAADRLGFARKQEMKASPLLTPYESESPEEDAAELTAPHRGEVYERPAAQG